MPESTRHCCRRAQPNCHTSTPPTKPIPKNRGRSHMRVGPAVRHAGGNFHLFMDGASCFTRGYPAKQDRSSPQGVRCFASHQGPPARARTSMHRAQQRTASTACPWARRNMGVPRAHDLDKHVDWVRGRRTKSPNTQKLHDTTERRGTVASDCRTPHDCAWQASTSIHWHRGGRKPRSDDIPLHAASGQERMSNTRSVLRARPPGVNPELDRLGQVCAMNVT